VLTGAPFEDLLWFRELMRLVGRWIVRSHGEVDVVVVRR
jgi:hypothetical protein